MQGLKGKTAIVTGAASPIGTAISESLSANGVQLMLADLDGDRVTALADRLGAIFVVGDLSDEATVRGMVQKTIDQYKGLDILVNNAGFSSRVRSVRYVQPDEWDSVFKVNIEAVYRLTQACLPDMIARGEGTIVTTSSMAAVKPGVLGGAPYSAAKAASQNFSHGLNAELRAMGIRATVILPAEVDTPILDGRPAPPDAAARKTMMQPEDVARCIHLAATLPPRTVIEEIVVAPTIPRDMSEEMAVARNVGAPE